MLLTLKRTRLHLAFLASYQPLDFHPSQGLRSLFGSPPNSGLDQLILRRAEAGLMVAGSFLKWRGRSVLARNHSWLLLPLRRYIGPALCSEQTQGTTLISQEEPDSVTYTVNPPIFIRPFTPCSVWLPSAWLASFLSNATESAKLGSARRERWRGIHNVSSSVRLYCHINWEIWAGIVLANFSSVLWTSWLGNVGERLK